MAEQKFKVGDEVIHKSGGPKMVVKGYEPPDGEEVLCEWFDKDYQVIEKAFHQGTLKIYEGRIYLTGPSRRRGLWD
jgi:uncharacterized protein YodC (DUF2158 family)